MNEKRKFLFRCEDCQMIISVDFDDPEEIEKIMEDELVLQCNCKGYCIIIRN